MSEALGILAEQTSGLLDKLGGPNYALYEGPGEVPSPFFEAELVMVQPPTHRVRLQTLADVAGEPTWLTGSYTLRDGELVGRVLVDSQVPRHDEQDPADWDGEPGGRLNNEAIVSGLATAVEHLRERPQTDFVVAP